MRVLPVTADLARPEEIDSLFEQAQTAFGPVSLLVNNAADLRRGRLLEFGLDDVDFQININIKGPYRCSIAQPSRCALPAGAA